MQCSSLFPSKPLAIVWFVSQMAWNFEDLQESFILKCMGNCYHYYCKGTSKDTVRSIHEDA